MSTIILPVEDEVQALDLMLHHLMIAAQLFECISTSESLREKRLREMIQPNFQQEAAAKFINHLEAYYQAIEKEFG